jgi:pilus assembly protein FimV
MVTFQTCQAVAAPPSRRVAGPVLASALALALCVGAPHALAAPALGGMSVLSEFGDPLRAEIEIRDVSAADADSIDAAIGSREDYARLGLPYPAALEGALVRVQRRPGNTVTVRIASRGPVADPELNMVLVLSGRFGRYLRNYQLSTTASASAPVAVSPVPAPAATPAPAAGPASASGPSASTPDAAEPNPRRLDLTPVPSRVEEPEPPRVAEPAPSQTAVAPASLPPVNPVVSAAGGAAPGKPDARSLVAEAKPGRSVRVRPGDTASTIVRQFKPADVTDRQAVLALYRRNQAAFGGSPDRLAAGVLLQVPDDAELRAAPRHEASAEVKPATPARAAGAPPADRLVLSGEGGKAGGKGRLGSDKAARVAALETAKAEADSRIRDLQKNVDDLNRLLEIRDRQLARLQENAQRRPVEPGAAGVTPVSAIGPAPGAAPIPPAGNPPVQVAAADASAVPAPAPAPAAAPAITPPAPPQPPAPVAAKAPEPADDDIGSLLADWRVQAAAGLFAAMLVLTGVMLTLRSTKPGGKRSLTARDGPPAAQRSKAPRGRAAAR